MRIAGRVRTDARAARAALSPGQSRRTTRSNVERWRCRFVTTVLLDGRYRHDLRLRLAHHRLAHLVRFVDSSLTTHELRTRDDARREDDLGIVNDVLVKGDLGFHERFGQVQHFRFDNRFGAWQDATVDFRAITHDHSFLHHRLGRLLNGNETRTARGWGTCGRTLGHALQLFCGEVMAVALQ